MSMQESYSRQGEEGDAQEGEAGGEQPSLPGVWGLVAIADRGQRNLQTHGLIRPGPALPFVSGWVCVDCAVLTVPHQRESA